MIEATSLSKRFGNVTAVDAVDFTVPAGEVVGFLGQNGAGKTTTIRMITGYLPPTDGTIEVDGLEVTTHSRLVRGRIGYLPEAAPLYTEMRVIEYLRFRARLFQIPRRERRAAIDRVVSRCWLSDVSRRPIGQLSKGYRQRVGLAAALLHDPPVLVLDEPTVGLDPAQILEVRRLIRELAGDHTVLFSTHTLPEVEATCDRVIVIANGRIRAAGTVDELCDAAASANAYKIETNNDETVESTLRKLPAVASVQSTKTPDGWRQLRVFAKDSNTDLRESLAGSLATTNATVREITRESQSLEELFIQLISDTPAEKTPQKTGNQPA